MARVGRSTQGGEVLAHIGVVMAGRQRVIITGASTGIGRALAVRYAAAGHLVGVTARRGDLLAELLAEVRASSGTVEAVPADVTDPTGLTAALHSLEARLGGVDLLIANAGVSAPTGGVVINPAGVESMMRVNFLGVVHAFAAVLPTMLGRGSGHLAAVASMAAYKGLPGAAGYCASKAAVFSYCEALRIELGGRGVAVTCVCPGFVATPMTSPNPHPMPWLMTADAAAGRIVRGLVRKPAVLDFPRRMRLLMALTRFLPDAVIRRRVPVERAGNPDSSA